jgi:uncharacterized protein with GYD domain
MPAYIVLNKLTAQGIRKLKDTTKRAETLRKAIEAAGGRVIGIWWTQGQYDSVLILDMPDEDSAMALLLKTSQQGNVTIQTMRAYSEHEMTAILARLA